MQTPVLILIGPPQHGKTEARRLLSDITCQKGASTSDVIYEYLAVRRGVTVESLRAIPKEELRPTLIAAGDFIVGGAPLVETAVNTEVDKAIFRAPSALLRMLYKSGYNIIDGIRRRSELREARAHLDWNGVRSLVIWVERPGVDTILDNTEVSELDADVTVHNNGTIEQLKGTLFQVLENTFGKQDELQKPVPLVEAGNAESVAQAVAAAQGAAPEQKAAA